MYNVLLKNGSVLNHRDFQILLLVILNIQHMNNMYIEVSLIYIFTWIMQIHISMHIHV